MGLQRKFVFDDDEYTVGSRLHLWSSLHVLFRNDGEHFTKKQEQFILFAWDRFPQSLIAVVDRSESSQRCMEIGPHRPFSGDKAGQAKKKLFHITPVPLQARPIARPLASMMRPSSIRHQKAKKTDIRVHAATKHQHRAKGANSFAVPPSDYFTSKCRL